MAYLVERRYDASEDDYYPDWDKESNRDGRVVQERSPRAAIRAYARQVLGSEDAIAEGDIYNLILLPDPERIQIKGRRVAFGMAPPPDDA